MKQKNILIFLALLSVCIIESCSKGGSGGIVDTGDNTGDIPATANTMTVTIDGVAKTYTAVGFKLSIFGDSSIIVVGSSLNSEGAGFGTLGINTKGTYNVGSEDTVNMMIRSVVMNYEYVAAGNDTVKYAAVATPGSAPVGTLTINELTSTNIKAAFHATLQKQSGIAGAATVSLTHGGVNATLN